jgi:hypothetical protein
MKNTNAQPYPEIAAQGMLPTATARKPRVEGDSQAKSPGRHPNIRLLQPNVDGDVETLGQLAFAEASRPDNGSLRDPMAAMHPSGADARGHGDARNTMMTASKGSDPAGYTDDAAETHVPRAERSHRRFERLIARTRDIPAIPTAVVWPDEADALKAPLDAEREQIIRPVLIGSAARIRAVADKAGLDVAGCTIVDVATETQAAAAAVRMVHQGTMHSIMKGSLHTDVLMREVVSADSGLRTSRRISHVFLIAAPGYSEILSSPMRRSTFFPTSTASATSSRTLSTCTSGLAWANRASPSCPPSRSSIRRSPAPPTPPFCARWPTAARSPAACWTARWPWTMPSARRRRR